MAVVGKGAHSFLEKEIPARLAEIAYPGWRHVSLKWVRFD